MGTWEGMKRSILLPFAAWLNVRLVGWLQRNNWPNYSPSNPTTSGAGGPGRPK